jgi:hypothetical protein
MTKFTRDGRQIPVHRGMDKRIARKLAYAAKRREAGRWAQ